MNHAAGDRLEATSREPSLGAGALQSPTAASSGLKKTNARMTKNNRIPIIRAAERSEERET